jgi:hypothetical protein
MNEDPTRINYRSYPRTPTVSYDLPMHGQRNIKKCKDQLLHDVEEWARGYSLTLGQIEQLRTIINLTFEDTLEK